MSDLQPQLVSSAAEHPHSAADPSATDELAHLARMSGTGSSFGQADYVALNTLAIACLLLGVAAALSLAINLFLFIPVAGIVCGLLAIRKIRRSNGTQGGMAFALAGIVLSLGLGGLSAGRETADWLQLRDETNTAANLMARFGDMVRDGQYDEAYDKLMASDFRDHFSRTTFTNTLHALQTEPNFQKHTGGYGHLESIKWNEKRMLVEPIGDNYTRLTAIALMKFHAMPMPGQEYIQLNNKDGEWRIQGIPRIFSDKPRNE